MKDVDGTGTIARRMTDYFERQIAAFEHMLGDLAMLDGELDDDDIEALATLQERHSRLANELAREFRALLKEWEAAKHIAAADRAAVGRRARQAEELAARLDARCAQGNTVVQEKMQSLRCSLDEVAVGRDVLRRYRVAPHEAPSRLDQKA